MPISLPYRLLWLCLLLPVLAWFVVKPLRVLAPTWVGVSCFTPQTNPLVTSEICLDMPARLPEAQVLQSEGIAFVRTQVGVSNTPLAHVPRLIFCATAACAQSFGLGERAAVTVGTWGIVFAPKAWQTHYVRHELIHVLQLQEFGLLGQFLKPQWLLEGMAYHLSQDPRPELPEPWQNHRTHFRTWLGQHTLPEMWEMARREFVWSANKGSE